jgi:DNA repair exonuclease SbcCD ATPase subunit
MNRIYDLYQSAVGRDGVPYKIIEQIIPVVESEVNQILNSMVDFTVALTAGTDKYITANIVYNDRGDEKFWPVELTSGMERFVLSLAFRTCLVELTNLPKSNFLVIDEGFGVLDNGNIMAIANLFTYLKERHDFIICVSHLDTMRDMVDGHLKIGKREGYSHIKV